MCFFFIAGIQPKTSTVADQPRMCTSCGLFQARLRRTDHYFALFFVPLFRVQKGTPFLECMRCGSLSGETGQMGREASPACPYCRTPLRTSFRFCPGCGRSLR